MKFFILVALIGLAAAGVFQHQLIRVESRKSKMIKEGTWEAYKEAKKLFKTSNKNDKTFKSISQGMNDYDDMEYLANVTVGTPEQQFLVVLDTGSADFWIPDSTCDSSRKVAFIDEDDQVCLGKRMFDSSNSSTYVETAGDWSIQYGTGSASGIMGQDTVRLGGMGEKQLIVPKTSFGQATYLDPIFANDSINGILGLAFPSLNEEGVDPVLFNAMKQGLLDKPIFTVFLQERGDEYNVPGGVITYGDLDTEHCSPDVNYVPLISESYYQYQLDSISFGNNSASDGWQIISDTGCTANLIPTELYNDLTQDIDVKNDGKIDCNATIPDLILTIGGKEYTIPSKQLILHDDDGSCELAMEPNNDSFILGDPFIRSYCNVFHLQDKQIGFAKVIA